MTIESHVIDGIDMGVNEWMNRVIKKCECNATWKWKRVQQNLNQWPPVQIVLFCIRLLVSMDHMDNAGQRSMLVLDAAKTDDCGDMQGLKGPGFETNVDLQGWTLQCNLNVAGVWSCSSTLLYHTLLDCSQLCQLCQSRYHHKHIQTDGFHIIVSIEIPFLRS